MLAAILVPPLLWGRAFLRRAARAAHGDVSLVDDVARIGGAIVVTLHSTARISLAIERVNVALLLVGAMLLAASQPPAQHGATVPGRR